MLRLLRVVGALGAVLRLFSLAFLGPVLIALVYDPYDLLVGPWRVPRNVLVFFFSFAATYLLGTSMKIAANDVNEADLQEREAYLTVGLGWLVLCVVAMVPFLLSGALVHPVDAYFETMSAMTTTGATVIPTMEDIDASVMMWRAILQFIGGMGIIVLSVAVLARLTQGGMQMLQAEAPGPSVTRVAPRLAQTARILWGVYALIAAVIFVVLLILMLRHGLAPKDAFFDAMFHAFTSLATGGFSNHTASIAFYDDWLIELVLIIAMLIGGANFTLHYHVMNGRWRNLITDPEWRFFMAMFAAISLIIASVRWRDGLGAIDALREAAFTVASLITATGFATADFDLWDDVAKFLLLLVMVTGGTAGSTSGGIKHIRILLLWKVVAREVAHIRHPHAVMPLRLAGRVIQPATIMATVGLFFTFVATWLGGTVLLIALDPVFTNPVDAASASISALSTVGPGFGPVGPSHSYAGLAIASKLTLTFLMWAGRLEIFTAFLVLMPSTWRH